MVGLRKAIATTAIIVGGMAVATTALAQGGRRTVDVAVTQGVPEFRDPKTGQVWTPETVGQDGRPIGPDDKAFDPRAQSVPLQAALQTARPKPVGTVPITAGPTVPLVSFDAATLRAVPGQRWQAVMYLDNNSANPLDPVLDCQFTNGGNPVMKTRVSIGQVGPGVRAGFAFLGPRTDVFVDRVSCQVVSP
jgi:hypothetical protein